MIILAFTSCNDGTLSDKDELPFWLPKKDSIIKEVLKDSITVMGRKTYETLKHRDLLPTTKKIVITKQQRYNVPFDVTLFNNVKDLVHISLKKDLVVIGGVSIIEALYPLADKLMYFHIDKSLKGDRKTSIRPLDDDDFIIKETKTFSTHNEYEFTFNLMERKKPLEDSEEERIIKELK